MSSNYGVDSRAFIVLDANFPNSTIGNVIKDQGLMEMILHLQMGPNRSRLGENYFI